MLTIILALLVGFLVAWASGSAMDNMAWGSVLGILALIAFQVVTGLIVRRKVNQVNTLIQSQLQEAQGKMQRKLSQMQQRPGASVKVMQEMVEKEQNAAVHHALETMEQLKKFYPWSLLLSRQINTMKMMFYYQIRDFAKVDALMGKCLLIEPTAIAMKIARMYKNNDPALDRFTRKKLKGARGDAGALLYALYSWILVKRDDVAGAVKLLADSKMRCANETLQANWERLANGKVKNFSNAALGDSWYLLHLEEPKIRNQRMRPQY